VSIDHWNALLLKAGDVGASPPATSVAILDVISDLVITTDAAGVITATSRAARMLLGDLCARGQRLENIAIETEHAVMEDAVRRVLASGKQTIVHLPARVPPFRPIRWLIVPHQSGVIFVSRNDTPTMP